MKRFLRFWILYWYAAYQAVKHGTKYPPTGIRGSALFMFFDPDYPERRHGVVAFLLPSGTSTEDFSDDLWGPFGYTSQIDRHGLHLYGRDTWGTVQEKQLGINPVLYYLHRMHPDQTIVLAGVRHVLGFHPYPLSDPDKFILVKK